tara:strand:+ start:245 stop:466 length:222 start_codon:yes stop_codon:yes gene_type:complete
MVILRWGKGCRPEGRRESGVEGPKKFAKSIGVVRSEDREAEVEPSDLTVRLLSARVSHHLSDGRLVVHVVAPF